MRDKDKPTIAEQFIALRIAEFPTLYHCGDQVIFSSVVSTQGSCYWDKKGILRMDDKHYNNKTKKWTAYPLQIPMKAAYSLSHSFGEVIHPYYNMSGPINKMPDNIEESWLLEISMFLSKWGKFSMDDFKLMATMHCMLHYGVRENPNAGLPQRTIDDFTQFHKKIPNWTAMTDALYYRKHHKQEEPAIYQGTSI